MPLTRYELRNEYSLANPDLYRAAAKDGPEGLLDGVAMAGLVGIVRQLGDLAEFAAEIFHDLHEEVLATAARGHELLIRMQQLEAELPFVEKLMLSERNYVNFAYNPGLEWHANIQNEQNHFTRGDLPRFIRNAYEDCRGPPRLFLLDKFDVAGAGACLKRYSDPSFFRMEWASSELMKAEKEQQDKKARRIKKKGRQQREMREASFVGQMQTRICPAPLEVEKAATSSSHAHIPSSQHSTEINSLHRAPQGHEQGPESSRLLRHELRHECDGLNSKPSYGPSLLIGKASIDSSALSRPHHQEPNESCVDAKPVSTELDSDKAGFPEIRRKVLPMGEKISENVTDFASETDNYMDALTTIESEVETDLDTKTSCQLVDKGLMPNHMDVKDAADAKQVFPDHTWYLQEMEVVAETNIHGVHMTPEEGDRLEAVKPSHVSSPDASLVKEKNLLFTDGDLLSQKSSASSPDSGSLPSTPALENLTINLEKILECRSGNGIRETPETPAASDHDVRQPETFSTDFHELPDSAVPLNNCFQNGFAKDNGLQNVFKEHINAVYFNLGDKTRKQPSIELSRPHSGKASFEDDQSDVSQDAEESSPQSSPVSSIQPMKWAVKCLRHPNIILDSDDELDGMQVSSPSSFSSNSALSSPRPLTLATTVFDNQHHSPLSPLMSSPESVRLVSPDSPGFSMELGASSSLLPGHLQSASQIHVSRQQIGSDFLSKLNYSCHDFPVGHPAAEIQDKDTSAEGLEHFPPPPPLPPLKWRTTTRLGGLMPSSTVSDSSSSFPFPQKSPWRIRESLEASSLPSLPSRVQLHCDDVPHAHEPSSMSQNVSQGLFMFHEMIKQSEIEEAYGSKTNLVNVDSSGKFFLEELATLSGTVNETVQLDNPAGQHMSMPYKAPFIESPEASFITDHPRHESTPLLQLNEPTCFLRSLSEGPLVDDEKELDATGSLIHENCAQVSSSNAISKTQETNARVSVPHEISEFDGHIKSFESNKQIPAPTMLEQLPRDFRSPSPSSALELDRASKPSMASKIERKDSLIAAIASHDKSTLRKIPQWSQSSRTTRPDDREVLLEQIRTGSFSLRRTRTEKQETPRPVSNINVAAILERANAIRQAFVGSDDDEEHEGWSDD